MLVILTTHPIQYQVPIWQALARDGRVPFEVWYLTKHGVEPSHDSEFKKQFSWDIDMLSGYPHRFLELAPDATPTSFWKCRFRERLRDRLKSRGATALWIQGWQVAAYWQAVWEAKRAGIEVWLRGESNDLAPTAWWKRPIKKLLLGQFFRRVDHFLYIGTANRRLYQKFGVPDNRLHPAPYAVDNERFAKQARELRGQRSEIRKQWKIPEDAFCVLFCGKFIPKKRPMDLVEAAKRVIAGSREQGAGSGSGELGAGSGSGELGAGSGGGRPCSPLPAPRSPLLHLLFVGSGELGPQLRASCNVVFDAEAPGSEIADSSSEIAVRSSPISYLPSPNSCLTPPASFAGFLNQTEISRAYVAADCLVLPSDYGETWGLVVNEAMASGLPCIISDRCGCSEDLGNISANKIFSCGDWAMLAGQLMERMASSPPPSSEALRRTSCPSPSVEEGGFSFDKTVSIVFEQHRRLRNKQSQPSHAPKAESTI